MRPAEIFDMAGALAGADDKYAAAEEIIVKQHAYDIAADYGSAQGNTGADQYDRHAAAYAPENARRRKHDGKAVMQHQEKHRARNSQGGRHARERGRAIEDRIAAVASRGIEQQHRGDD